MLFISSSYFFILFDLNLLHLFFNLIWTEKFERKHDNELFFEKRSIINMMKEKFKDDIFTME